MAKVVLGPSELVKLFVVTAVKIKRVVRNHKSKKNRQMNRKKDKNTNYGLENITQNTKD